jgi:dihydropteroate synthase
MVNTKISWGNHTLILGKRTIIMGIVNVTPDSFSDGGQFFETDVAMEHGKQLVRDGADIIDIGGESTRPGSLAVTLEEELDRVIPVIKGIAGEVSVPISIDTCKPEVARAALDAGASIINDVSAGRFDPKIVDIASESEVPLILMHMQGIPKNMQKNPIYDDMMRDIQNFLNGRIEFATSRGVARDMIIIDPGIGFGKTLEHNYEIVRNLDSLKSLKLPILVGPSRKSFIGNTLDLPTTQRLEGTLAVVTMCIMKGADIVRVHDVKEAALAVRMTDAIYRKRGSSNLIDSQCRCSSFDSCSGDES